MPNVPVLLSHKDTAFQDTWTGVHAAHDTTDFARVLAESGEIHRRWSLLGGWV
jgi:hypothetical protein